MSENMKKIPGFVIFCLEAYKREKKLDGAAVAESFEKHGVIDYLSENYDLLHTLGESALVEDIDKYLSKREKNAEKKGNSPLPRSHAR